MFSTKEIRPLKKAISSFEVTEFQEESRSRNVFLRFKLDGVHYRMYLHEEVGKENTFVSSSVFHEKQKCPFCLIPLRDDGRCHTLYGHKKELFYHVIKQSKNRLRWLTAEVW